MMKVYVPGKLILSGEHSVVYGKPALAMAINRYVTATVTQERHSRVLFDLADLTHYGALSLSALYRLKDRIKRKYARFIRGDFSIRRVLQKPFELTHLALGVFIDALNLSMSQGMKIHITSTIPMGCGLGSSAATILSVMLATARHLNISLTEETLFELALQAENMQHGYSSGIDLRIAMLGGCLYFNDNSVERRALPQATFYLINTGTPASTTGQCVEQAASYFYASHLAEDFASVTHAFDLAIQRNAVIPLREAIRENHRLLTYIGVVPERVQKAIRCIELLGGAAKICGSGAIIGSNAGSMLVSIDDVRVLEKICQEFSYFPLAIAGERRGMYAF